MKGNKKPNLNRRDFLKGVGLAGSGVLVSLVGGNEYKNYQINQPKKPIASGLNRPLIQVTASSYNLEISGFPIQNFTSCTNMGSINEPIEHKIVDSGKEIVRVLPGTLSYNDIILERDLSTDMTLWGWLEDVGNSGYKKEGSIVAFNDESVPIAQWDFHGAWPREVSATLQPSQADPGILVLTEHTILAVDEIYKPA